MTMLTSRTISKAVSLISQLHQGAPVAVDCETTGLRPYQGDTLRGFSFAFRLGDEIHTFYVPVGYVSGNLWEGAIRSLLDPLHAKDPLWVFHHAKFDLRFLRQLPKASDGSVYFAVPAPERLWDTKTVAWLMDESLAANPPNGIGTSLEAQSQHHLGEGKSDYMRELVIEKGKEVLKAEGVKRPKVADCLSRGWALVTAEETAEYGSQDAALTLRLFEVQRDMILEDHPTIHGNPGPAIEREMRITALLLRVEDNGIKIDTELLAKMLSETETRIADIEEWFTSNYAVDINKPNKLRNFLFNTMEYESIVTTGRGAPSVNRQALEMMPQNETTSMIMEHRRLTKALSGYLAPLSRLVAPDGRVHPTFWQSGTVTGRFSCSDPNLQTIPRADKLAGVRDLFTAEDDMELWEYDLAAAELRVMAGWAGETRLIDALEQGTDMHSANARTIFGDGFTGLQRRASKNIMYGWSYGLTKAETATKYLVGPDCTYQEAIKLADEVLAGMKELYPNIFDMMGRKTWEAERRGYMPISPDGRWPGRFRRYTTEAPIPPRAYTALNAQVQGGIAELMKDIMLEVEPKLDAIGAHICLQVHDSLVIEVPAGYRSGHVQGILQTALDKLNPFAMRMLFDAAPWQAHE